MLRYVIPALALTVLVNPVAMAQFFGAEYPSAPSLSKPGRPVRIARASETESPLSPLDDLDELDQLDALGEPPIDQKPAPLPALRAPQSLDVVDAPVEPQTDVVAEELAPPTPAKSNGSRPSSPSDKESPKNQVQHSLLTPSPITGPINLDDAIVQQQRDLAYPQLRDTGTQYYSGLSANTTIAAYGLEASSPHHHGAHGCGDACGTSIPNHPAILPPARSFHSYFRSNPCYFDIWASYPAEAAAACAHNRAKLAPRTGCKSCELLEPCRNAGCH